MLTMIDKSGISMGEKPPHKPTPRRAAMTSTRKKIRQSE